MRAEFKWSTYSQNEAILHLDLQNQSGVVLTGKHWSLSDEDHDGDGISISDDGVTWQPVVVAVGQFRMALPPTTTQVKFRQYDNYPADSDGREWDDIRIEREVPPTPQMLPYTQDFTTLSGRAEGWEYVSTKEGRIQVMNGRLRMDDTTGNTTYSQNEAILHLDLQGSDGVTWQSVVVGLGSFEVALPPTTIRVKFMQYDNYPADSDGREWDNIEIVARDYSQPIPWPAKLGFHKDLFNDGGAELTSGNIAVDDWLGLSNDNLLTSSYSTTNAWIGGTSSDLNGVMIYPDDQPRYRVVFINGGNATHHYNALNTAARAAFRTYYANGGSLAGSCAGSFIMDERLFSIIPVYNGVSGYSGIYHDATFTADDGRFYEILQTYGIDTAYDIGHFGGPKYVPRDDDPIYVEYLGTITGTSTGLRDTPYYVSYKGSEDTGRAITQPSHPEFKKSGSQLYLMAAMVTYAMEGTGIPDLKGALITNEFVTMGGTEEKLGDQQYHRWTVEVSEDTAVLDISLDGLGGNVDLYVQYDSMANSQSYLYKSIRAGSLSERIQINNPQAGTYHVSAYGNHEVLNGVAYTLTATDGGSVVPFSDTPVPQTTPYFQDFTTLPNNLEGWEYASTNNGLITAVSGRLKMDSLKDAAFSQNEAILHLNMAGQSGLRLSGYHWNIDDESHSGDGIAISADGGTWYTLTFDKGMTGLFDIDLDAAITAVGISYTLDFRIKFMQYDNYSANTDGRGWDSIRVMS